MVDASAHSARFETGVVGRFQPVKRRAASIRFPSGLQQVWSICMDCPKGTSACGAGVRLAGDVVYSRMPQISVGVQHKRNRDLLIPRPVGAPEDDAPMSIWASPTSSACVLAIASASVYRKSSGCAEIDVESDDADPLEIRRRRLKNRFRRSPRRGLGGDPAGGGPAPSRASRIRPGHRRRGHAPGTRRLRRSFSTSIRSRDRDHP